ncbi:MAG: GGDEF domain-containing protein [Defluviitaleaceae bacterium]|nr:GGDEF domain-containing protein [Defluviitaleaceae bacterium]
MEDIFYDEQKILDDALIYSNGLQDGASVDKAQYDNIVKEYGRLLRQIRRVTKLSDRTTGGLNESKHDLLNKVHFDALTGIYSRWFMEESLKRIVKSLARSGGTLSVLMIDIDFFKNYNDTYGHRKGDICLRVVAETIAGALSRPDDFAARYGGEEFVVIMPNTEESGARFIADKILKSIRALNITHEKSEAAEFITVSIGVTTSDVNLSQSDDDYIKQADKALYQSKQNGRNRYTYIDF